MEEIFQRQNKASMPKYLWFSAGLAGARSILCPWQSSPVSQTKIVPNKRLFHFKGICRDHKLRLREINNLNSGCFVVQPCPECSVHHDPEHVGSTVGPLLIQCQRCPKSPRIPKCREWGERGAWGGAVGITGTGRREVARVRKWNIYGETKWSKDLCSTLLLS